MSFTIIYKTEKCKVRGRKMKPHDQESGFANVLKSCRRAAGLTQKDVADRAGLSPSYIALLESGERKPPRRDVTKRLANACNVNAAFFIRAASSRHEAVLPHHVKAMGSDAAMAIPSSLEMANDKLLSALVKILQTNAPELSYAQTFQKVVGLPLWWKLFTVCLHENLTGVPVLTSHEKLFIQEKVVELEKLDGWLSMEDYATDYKEPDTADSATMCSLMNVHQNSSKHRPTNNEGGAT
jgi:transcriptional regulator with XRE-family HTH domain